MRIKYCEHMPIYTKAVLCYATIIKYKLKIEIDKKKSGQPLYP